MRLQRRPQGRIPIRLAPTKWEFLIEGEHYFTTSSLSGLHVWLLEQDLQPDSLVDIWRNDRHIYAGPWQGLVGDGTLW